MPEPTLESLLARYRRHRDDAAFEAIVGRTRPRLLRVARRIVPGHAAEDCLQLAYLSLVREREGEFAPQVLPWLITATVRIAYAAKAKEAQQLRLARQLQHAPATGDEPTQAFAADEAGREVRRRVAELPIPYRDPIQLHHLEGLAVGDVAALLEISTEAAKKRIQRGRALLRTRLDPRLATPLIAPFWLLGDLRAGVSCCGGMLVKKKALVVVVLLVALVGIGSIAWLDRAVQDDAGAKRTAAARELTQPGSKDGEEAGNRARIEVVGRVIDALGSPVPDAVIEGAAELARTGPDGGFRALVDPGASWRVRKAGYTRSAPRVAEAGAPVVVRLDRGTNLGGVVNLLDGTPVAGARVQFATLHRGRLVEQEAVTDAQGRYQMVGLPRARGYGATRLRADADGLAATTIEGLRLMRPVQTAPDLVLTAGATIRGRVTARATGRPVAGARVELRMQQRPIMRPGAFHDQRESTVALAATTDDDGMYVLRCVPARGFGDIVEDLQKRRQPLGRVHVTHPEYVSMHASVPILNPGETSTSDHSLRPLAILSGRVVDEEGRPVAGARVGRGDPGTPVGTDGRFEYAVPGDAHEPIEFVAFLPECADSKARFARSIAVRPGARIDLGDVVIPVDRLPLLRLLVRDADGRPVAGARASMNQDRFLGASRGFFTDATGAVAVRDSFGRGKKVHVFVSAAGYAPVAVGPFDPFRQSDVIPVRLGKGRLMAGRAVWRDGSPASDVSIFVMNPDVDVARGAGNAHEDQPAHLGLPPLLFLGASISDAEGRFEVPDLPPGRCHILALRTIVADGGERRVGAHVLDVETDRTDVVVTLAAAATFASRALRGTIIDGASGEPVVHASVVLRRGDATIEARRPGPGRFVFDEVNEGRWTLVATAPGFDRHEQGDLEVGSDSRGASIAIAMRRGIRLEGRVRAPAGVGKITIQFRDERGRRTENVDVAPDGTFHTTDLKPGVWYAQIAAARGTWLAPKRRAPLVIKAGQGAARWDEDLVRAGRMDVLRPDARAKLPMRYRILDENGEEVRAASEATKLLSVPLAPGNYSWTWSDAEAEGKGSFSIRARVATVILVR